MKQFYPLMKIALLSSSLLLTINKAQAFDIEIDPTAYGFNGYSVHAGFGDRDFRLDVGIFGMDIPTAFHGDDNFDLEFQGYGVKLDYLFGGYDGWFAGLELASNEITYTLDSTDRSTKRTQTLFGPRIGYRFMLTENITITPWLGINFELDPEDVEIDGVTFETSSVSFFPAVHLGWHF